MRTLFHLAAVLVVVAVLDTDRRISSKFTRRSGPGAFDCIDYATDEPIGTRVWKRYRAADGAQLWFQDLDFLDREHARAALTGYLHSTVDVVETGTRSDANHAVLGPYAIVRSEHSDMTTYQAMWIVGSHFVLVEGPTREHAEALMHVLDGAAKFHVAWQ